MRLRQFDIYAFADYSGAASEREQRKHIAWCVGRAGGEAEEPATTSYTREELVVATLLLLGKATAAGERVIFGFDHNYGLPDGLYEAATGASLQDWRQQLAWLAEGLMKSRAAAHRAAQHGKDDGGRTVQLLPSMEEEPRPREWAARVNAMIAERLGTETGPFWGPHFTPSRRLFPFADTPLRLPERRVTETRRPGMKSAYQLGGAGSVGLQSLFGMARLHELLRRCNAAGIPLHCWPFDGWTPPPDKHVMVEVYPTIYLAPTLSAPPAATPTAGAGFTAAVTGAGTFAARAPSGAGALAGAAPAAPTPTARPNATPTAGDVTTAAAAPALGPAGRQRRTDAGDAAACVRWAREQDRLGRLGVWLAEPPGLTPEQRRRVALEGWVLGVR
ncbi:hypothetical protein SD70_18200 [Gordoniibacillus kamchatkensis]|uniref:Uncharacterized protein n=1 Tax=Gordoniibacillus kamchatkensis TaxID=1590651 RepID=A0ABR5AFG7_9BACL|nr:hypothetical protein SD70_18200 [Paenibacillus sp. VKM B-2647]